ncbi:hypothetical protein MFUR16E_30040 [Methylobacterium fujisawaense]|uniref:hypothetical protein n=1 Tax=Methylobacterium TaxID=407 RepID=UPI0014779E5B|nr:hypothetical protein [Methylobacterium oryzae]UIN35497.1 hypothetical protein LXM90_03085 [Methylobacterium oryzae]
MAHDDSFTLDQAITAQKALRSSLGMKEEVFEAPEFVGMISDEIEQHRKAGKTDQEIAAIINQATGKGITAEAIAEHYASPEQRHPHGG